MHIILLGIRLEINDDSSYTNVHKNILTTENMAVKLYYILMKAIYYDIHIKSNSQRIF